MSKNTKEVLENTLKKAQLYSEKLTKLLAKAQIRENKAADKLTIFDQKEQDAAAKFAANPYKINKVGTIPVSQLSIAELAQRVAANWENKFPNIQIPNINYSDLATNAANITIFIKENAQIITNKKTNTNQLAAVNKRINTAVSQLKRNLAAIYPAEELNLIHHNYGLMLSSKKIYDLPVDNTVRIAKIGLIITKLQEAGNPLAQLPNFSLRQWLQLQQEHRELWNTSNFLREEKSRYVSSIDEVYQSLRSKLKKIYDYIPFLYEDNLLKSVRRQLGFLKESF